MTLGQILYKDTPETKSARDKINLIFEEYLIKGYNILYSGNPEYMPRTKVLIIPKKEDRWERLKKREIQGEWCPKEQQFEMEDVAYEKMSSKINTIRGEISKSLT